MSRNHPRFGNWSGRPKASIPRSGPSPSFTLCFIATFAKAGFRNALRAKIASRFSGHIENGLWTLIPVGESLLRRSSALLLSASRDLFVRTADAVHLITAQEAGEAEIWTNDRHMLAAADYFGLIGRRV